MLFCKAIYKSISNNKSSFKLKIVFADSYNRKYSQFTSAISDPANDIDQSSCVALDYGTMINWIKTENGGLHVIPPRIPLMNIVIVCAQIVHSDYLFMK